MRFYRLLGDARLKMPTSIHGYVDGFRFRGTQHPPIQNGSLCIKHFALCTVDVNCAQSRRGTRNVNEAPGVNREKSPQLGDSVPMLHALQRYVYEVTHSETVCVGLTALGLFVRGWPDVLIE
jgi:hypothetical protein